MFNERMKFLVIFLALFGILVLPAHAQYMGNVNTTEPLSLEEFIGIRSPEQQLIERIHKDQNNAILVLAIGIPFLVLISFLVWRIRK